LGQPLVFPTFILQHHDELNSLAWTRVIGPEGGVEDGVASAGVGEGTAEGLDGD
jgi:hypothetical protein